MQKQVVLAMVIFMAGPTWAADVMVGADQSIQDAINQVKPGDTIHVEPGTYFESLHIDKPNITLRGVIRDGVWPKLDGQSERNDGIIATGSGLTIENLRIVRYKANGITTQGANDVVIRHVIVEDTGIYGIYPTYGRNILVEDTVTSKIADAGIYIGMCENVDVRRNELFENVAGIEIENSKNVLVEDNNVYNNTGGILVFALPGLPKKECTNVIVRNNHVIDNNHYNFAEAGAIVASVPPGSGILVLASDDVVIEHNIVRRNSFAGVIVADLGVMGQAEQDPELEPNPDRVAVLKNTFHDNGRKSIGNYVNWFHFLYLNMFTTTPDGADAIFPPGADIAATGKGSDNCYTNDSGAKTYDTDHFKICPEDFDSQAQLRTMLTGAASKETEVAAADLGKHWYNVVCTGCHALEYRLIGPAFKEVQEKYKDNPEGIVDYAMKPSRVRRGYPEMPSQAHLGKDKLLAVAKHILTMTK